jgi:hypothetical protein
MMAVQHCITTHPEKLIASENLVIIARPRTISAKAPGLIPCRILIDKRTAIKYPDPNGRTVAAASRKVGRRKTV